MRRNLNMNETQGGINLGGPAGSVSSNLSMLTMIRFDLRLSFCFDRLLVTVMIMLANILQTSLFRDIVWRVNSALNNSKIKCDSISLAITLHVLIYSTNSWVVSYILQPHPFWTGKTRRLQNLSDKNFGRIHNSRPVTFTIKQSIYFHKNPSKLKKNLKWVYNWRKRRGNILINLIYLYLKVLNFYGL